MKNEVKEITPNTKPLYILVSDGGDGSFYPAYTFDTELIELLEEAAEDGRMDYENGIGCDGDGFHYEIINVPEECTKESLGISTINPEYYYNKFGSTDE